jgi:hypothetical protein
VHQLEHIRLRVLAAASLDLVGDLPEALFESRRVAGVRPEYPRVRRLLSSAVAVLDGQLRLPVPALDASANKEVRWLTPRRRGPPALLAMLALRIARGSDQAASRGRHSLHRGGTARSTRAAGESRDALKRRCVVSAALSRREQAPASRNMEVVLDSAGIVPHLRSEVAMPKNTTTARILLFGIDVVQRT